MPRVIEFHVHVLPEDQDFQVAGNALSALGFQWCESSQLKDYVRALPNGQSDKAIYALKPLYLLCRPWLTFCKPGEGDVLYMEDGVESYPRPAGTGILGYKEIPEPEPVPAEVSA